jgi:hypothetical protein
MTANRKLAAAWTILPAPVVLFIPAFNLASRGRAASSYPLLIVVANALFTVMEGAAFSLFAKHRPVSISSLVGCILALGMVVLCILVEILLLTSRM